jgi:hypothetical protein
MTRMGRGSAAITEGSSSPMEALTRFNGIKKSINNLEDEAGSFPGLKRFLKGAFQYRGINRIDRRIT